MTNTVKNNPLEQQVFQDSLDFKTLENILETLDYVKAEKISREDFNNLKGDFLVEDGEEKFGKKYILKLPEDLKIYELPVIIRRINKITFGKESPLYSSTEELKYKIILAYKKLLEIKKKNENYKDINKALKKYYLLYTELTSDEEANNLNKENYLNKKIEEFKKNSHIEKHKKYIKKLTEIKTKEDLSELNDMIAKEIENNFLEAFFEKGVNLLRYGIETITQIEIEQRKKYLEENGYKKEIKYGKMYYLKGGDKIYFLDKEQNIDKKEQKLRDKIGIEKLKIELKKARIEGNQEKINKLEIKASNKILKTIREFPYADTENNYGYQPSKIAKYKKIQCVGFALLGHAFLSELGIKHNGLDIPSHSALEVLIGGKKYYFDGTASDEIIEYEYKGKIGVYNKTSLDTTPPLLVNPGNPEKLLGSQILNNKGVSLDNLGNTTGDKQYFKEAIKMDDKAIELNPSYANAYNNKGASLDHLGNTTGDKQYFKEAIKMYDKAIELNPSYANAYHNKGVSLDHLGEYKLSKLYKYAYEKMKRETSLFEILYKKEKRQIDNFVEKRDFECLRKYLLDLEKKQINK